MVGASAEQVVTSVGVSIRSARMGSVRVMESWDAAGVLFVLGEEVAGELFFFFKSEFIFRNAYNVAQRRSCRYYTICLGM